METELKALVERFAKFNPVTNNFEGKPDKKTLLELDKQLNHLFRRALLSDGHKVDQIRPIYKRLALHFHPDKAFSPAVTWLNKVLPVTESRDYCFTAFKHCYDLLCDPQKFKKIDISEVRCRGDFKNWLEGLKNDATTYTSRSFYANLLEILEQSSSFFDEVGQLNSFGLRALLTFFPIVFGGCAYLVPTELFAIYTLYHVVLEGGNYLNNTTELKNLGQTLDSLSVVTATATTRILVELLKLTFWTSRKCYNMSLKIGSNLLSPPLISANSSEAEANLCTDLIIASGNQDEGLSFINPELKSVAAPIESYLGINSQQFFKQVRVGREKRVQCQNFLFKLRVIDGCTNSLTNKLLEAAELLTELKENKVVYVKGSETAKAIDQSWEILEYLVLNPVGNMLLIESAEINPFQDVATPQQRS